ncbi:adenosylcobinamide-GDP ribazoletransferase [Pseudanabaena sp. PCC 6802]|uniref:adenosylcobinamide-GDP ribazoletransferase n=1 Tax=Pseudanabaena sp. PCC 6802 TaxID=118173 RepID=UPI00036BC32A|nr:adenosylcobinamide-GDP ribazoletransferase [Pseudanabaena sp. PCC 6802]
MKSLMFFQTIRAAFVFYTCLPLSKGGNSAALDFRGIAVYAPLVGAAIGAILGGCDLGLALLLHDRAPLLVAGLIVLLGVWLTGGLHLDGAMDTADGLAVTDPERRLEVMADSTTGAYGVMAAIAILFLKTASLAAIDRHRLWILIAACTWSRWGQLRAIAAYPYLKSAGKGKFHRDYVRSWQVWLVFGAIAIVSGVTGVASQRINLSVAISLAGTICAWGTGAWLNYKLGGQTGDTYGAIVEWSESFFFLVLVPIASQI